MDLKTIAPRNARARSLEILTAPRSALVVVTPSASTPQFAAIGTPVMMTDTVRVQPPYCSCCRKVFYNVLRKEHMAWTDLCKFADLNEKEGKFIAIGDRNLALFLNHGEVFVCDDACPHAGASLAGGFIEEGYITCPWHYWSFSCEDGTMAGGGRAKIRVYRTRLEGSGPGAIVQADLEPVPGRSPADRAEETA